MIHHLGRPKKQTPAEAGVRAIASRHNREDGGWRSQCQCHFDRDRGRVQGPSMFAVNARPLGQTKKFLLLLRARTLPRDSICSARQIRSMSRLTSIEVRAENQSMQLESQPARSFGGTGEGQEQ